MSQCKCRKKLIKRIIGDDQTESNNTCEIVATMKKEEIENVEEIISITTGIVKDVGLDLPKKAIKKKPKKIELLKQIESQNSEIEVLGSKIKELNGVIENNVVKDLTRPASFAIKKGDKLNKLSLRLKCEVDILRASEVNYIKKIELLEQDLKEARKQPEESKEVAPVPDNSSTSSISDLHTLQGKFTKTKGKLFDALNQNAKLKNELKVAQKCIQLEIGDNVNLSTLVGSSSTGWRGREQKIISLQNNIADLKQKLENATNSKQFRETPKNNEIRQTNSFHRTECENLQSEIYKLREVIEYHKGKINALKAHKSVLSEDTSKSKEKLLQLLEKSENDDKYIKKLNEQLEAQAQHYDLIIKDLYAKISEVDKLKYDLNLENSKLLVKLENVAIETNEKTKTITELNEHAASLETDLRSICGGFLFSCREFTKDQFLGIINRLEAEKEELLEFIKTLNNRSDESMVKLVALQEENGKLKISNAKVEARLKKYDGGEFSRFERSKDANRILPVNSLASHSNSNTTLPACNLIDLEELRFNCESLRERITFLEENLQEIKYEKEMDWKIYTDIISKSKNIIIESFDKENKKN